MEGSSCKKSNFCSNGTLSSHSTTQNVPSSSMIDPNCTPIDGSDQVNGQSNFQLANCDEDSEEEKVLCVIYRGGMVGIAVYCIETEELLVYQEVPDVSPEFPYLEMALLEIAPSTILRSYKEDVNIQKVLSSYASAAFEMPEESRDSQRESQISRETSKNRIKIEVLPNNAFNLDKAISRIAQSRLDGEGPTSSEEALLKLVSVLPQFVPSSGTPSASIQAAGAIVYVLDRWRNSKDIERAMEGRRYRVESIRIVSMKNLLRIDPDTIKGLKIFMQDFHPSAYKSSFLKEGFSLFEAMNKCRSTVGSSMLRSIFLRPTRDIEELERRFKAISFFRNPRHNDILTTLTETLQRVRKINRILAKLDYCNPSLQEWTTLYQTTSSLASIIHLSQKLPQDIEIFKKLSELGATNEPYRVARAIQHIIDFDKTKDLEQFTVKPGIDATLDELRKKHNELPGFLSKVNVEEAKSLPIRSECRVAYYPELGFLLGIPYDETLNSPGSLMILGYQFMFTANGQAFYKSARCKELDESIGDIHVFILDLETRLCKKLCAAIREHSGTLIKAINLVALLDCYISLAIAAEEHHLVMPQFLPRKEGECCRLKIMDGRNLLQELAIDSVVPNDTDMGNSQPRLHILTGPNASGKSVYIRQIGVIVFLAHIGSCVPAREAHLTTFDAIYSRLNDFESVSSGFSSFAKDLNQMVYAVKNATSNSLVLIDEFGIGTSEVDGKSLFVSAINHWLQVQPESPIVVASTHFHDIDHLLDTSANLGFKRMDFMEESGEIIPLFKVIDGKQDFSYALNIAIRMGIPQDCLDRVREISCALRENNPIPNAVDDGLASVIQRIFCCHYWMFR
ncbi:mutS protein homolog 5-like isoform X2 [Artemia franciscana]|uniref:Uncharacterized protein n=1 Tax=Artemia franciscana TaxID=6661 RepID=A0AA88HV73_ARTSF|nr:hypothetical protein QYM36_007133 [Artemia franciscana]KAK2716884.1 hypothetical protein QYM36_007133 [Artemia franciscana]